MIITNNLTFDLIGVVVTLVLGLVLYLKWGFGYWNRLGVPSLNPTLPYGDLKDFLRAKITQGELLRQFYHDFKSKGHKHGGLYFGTQPVYLPIDPELVKHIMQKDFSHFMNHGNYINEEADPLSGHLFNLEDTKWRNMRVKLTPTFTSGKMKMMFQTLADCSVGLRDIMQDSAVNHTPVDIKDVLARFTTDIIGSCAFGLECNSLKNPDAEFRKYGRKVFEVGMIERLKIFALLTIPHSILNVFKFSFTNKEVEKFFMKAIKDTVNYREKNNIYRKDFMHLLLQLKNRGKVTDDDKITDGEGKYEEKALTMNELSAQAFVFFLAGFETSSTTMTFALYELATNQHVQEKLREEINTVLKKHNGKMTYDAIIDMTYMDKVLHETLRKYPPVAVLNRECNTDYKIPKTDITLKKGVKVAIPVLALHTDPEYYPDPEKFDPERFDEEIKNQRPAFTWLPFGEGPRLCIGLRFGMMQSKVGLTTLLKNYKINLSKKTKLPMTLEPKAFVTSAAGGIWLDVEKLE